MAEHAESHQHGDEQQSLNLSAFSATVHCLTGCAIGEVLGMILATWWGWGNGASIALSIVLAFFFGYSLTLGPVLRAGVPFVRARTGTMPPIVPRPSAGAVTRNRSRSGYAYSRTSRR